MKKSTINEEKKDCWTCIHHDVCYLFRQERKELFTGKYENFEDISDTWKKSHCNNYKYQKLKEYTIDNFKQLLVDEINYTNDFDILFTIHHFVNLIHKLKD